MKPRLLDLYCGAGGAAVGYHRAGFEVVGVDKHRQPRYPFEFHQADALDYPLDGFDAYHASPPCQGYSAHVTSRSSKHAGTLGKDEPRHIAAIRERLVNQPAPFVIENVIGAANEMLSPILLCGVMFGLPISRHRLFERRPLLPLRLHPECSGTAKRFAADRGWDYRDMTVTGKGRRAGTSTRWKEILGITHDMSQAELREAIPPAYTQYIGEQMLPHVLSRMKERAA